MTKRLLIGTLPVILGGLIYLTYRTDTLLMFSWFKKVELSEEIEVLRSNQFLQSLNIPNWVKFNLPGALWLFSFNYILLAIWDFKISYHSVIWLFLAPAIGLFSEIGQLIGMTSGTFDLVDLLMLLIATGLPFLSVKKFKSLKVASI